MRTLSLVLAVCIAAAAQTRRLTTPEDLFAVKQITSLALAPDGQRIAYITREESLGDDKSKTVLWVMPTASARASAQKVLDDCDSPQWSPDGKLLGCIAPRSGKPQIIVFNAETLTMNAESAAPSGVVSFQWSPAGRVISFLSREAAPATPGSSERGVVVDKRTFSVYKLLGNELFLDLARPVHLYQFDPATRSIEPLITSFDVEAANWSPDGKNLAVTGKDSSEFGYPSSIYLFSMTTKRTTRILEGKEQNDFPVQDYSRPTWSPDGAEIAAVSVTSEDRWANSGNVGIYSIASSKFRQITDENHLQLYSARFFWLEKAALTFENTVHASTQLFRLSPDGKTTPLTHFDGDNSLFALSRSGDQVALVHQTFQHPPEIYTTRAPFSALAKLTAINESSDHTVLPAAERVQWPGAGGVQAEGWLIKPAGYQPSKRYPLLVMIHGGPGVAVKDSYEPYMLFGQWAWPYPFRIFAERGYLVFIPNYRGTGSYGKQFEMFKDMAGEPADDIVTGIQYLIRRGDADANLVGIMGQSHGGWLGPYVLTHHKTMFKAASFAEGALNTITQYGMMPGWLNLYTHEFYNPGNPYDNLQRLIEMSPIFDIKGLDTPTMLEFGQRSLAVLGLETVTALWREGVPHEMVVYPKEGHNLMSPVNQLESMNRNLDWFDFWMFGKKNPDQNKAIEYARWNQMAKEMKAMRENNAKSSSARSQNR